MALRSETFSHGLRFAYFHQPLGEYLHIAMEPVAN
jgi:hypothetical protein